TDPGEYTIQYYSVDVEENIETSKSVFFTIVSDTVPPEVDISFDSQTLTPILTAIDENPVTETVEILPKNREKHTFTDTFANQLILTGIYTLDDQTAQFRIESLQYNTDPVITPEANLLKIQYLNPISSVTNIFGQERIIKDELQLKLVYKTKSDQTSIFTEIAGAETVKEVKPGKVVLHVKTNKGELGAMY
ncbi:MAG: hypothetical protein UV17_C0028G0001, partial [Candidatus Gottesmanbacteria bacterium GW2011_GWA1_42_26]